jgi:NADPH-dependent curcumin reductase CurA
MMTRQVVLTSRPVGAPVAGDFAIRDVDLPDLAPGEFRVRNHLLSLDPGIRQRLSQVDSYVKLIDLGAPVTSTTLGIVEESRDPRAAVGDHVIGFHTIAERSNAIWGPLTRKIDPAATAALSHHLSVLGPTGLTAYFGLLEIGRPRAGETVLVSAAAGAVGSIAAQIARIQGCRVVGIAGGARKAARLIDEFGLDAAIDYRDKDLAALTAAIRAAAPAGVDVFFDNVGGVQLDAALDCLNPRGRVALCGLISQYNAAVPEQRFRNMFKLIAKSARIEGFVVLSYAERFPDALRELAGWIRDGRLTFREQIEEGLEAAIPGFLRLFDGTNDGKMMVRLP